MKYFGWIVLGAIVVVAALAWTGYNGLVSSDEAVKGAWSEVQNQLKRRTDLIGNLVETVKGSAAHEHSTLADLVKERAKLSQAISVDVSKLANDPEAQKKLLEAQNGMTTALTRFVAVAESYPQLKANESFLKLQDELAGTENRVAVARGRAIAATQEYNKGIRTFPAVFIARQFGFTTKEYYQVPEGEQKAPQVHF